MGKNFIGLIKGVIFGISAFYLTKVLYHYYKYTIKNIPYHTPNITLNECDIGDIILYRSQQRPFDLFTKTMMNAHFNHVGIYAGNGNILHITYNSHPSIDPIINCTSDNKKKCQVYVRKIKHWIVTEKELEKCVASLQKEKMNNHYISFWFDNRIRKTDNHKFLSCAIFVKKCYQVMGIGDIMKGKKINMPDDYLEGLDDHFGPLLHLIFSH